MNLLEKLTDHKIIKDEDEIFSINDSFSLILTIDKSANPKYVGIRNPNLKTKELFPASVKNVTIFFDYEFEKE